MAGNQHFMREAIRLSRENVEKGGGPFGAVVVKDGQIIASGVNEVTRINDPTAHAEVMAIRNAAQTLYSFDLTGCELYTSCEPCPMCLSAIYWARIKTVYYGNSRLDAAQIGFDDRYIEEELQKPPAQRSVVMERMLQEEAFAAFSAWNDKDDKISY